MIGERSSAARTLQISSNSRNADPRGCAALCGARPLHEVPRISRAILAMEAQATQEERDQVRSAQLAEFNQELGRRLVSLDRGQRVDPVDARDKLERKSRARRKSGE